MRSAGSEVRVVDRLRLADLDEVAAFDLLFLGGFFGLVLVRLFALDDIDAHLIEHRQNVLDLLGVDFLRRQHRIQFAIGDKAALLGELDHPLDGGIRQIEQRAVGRLDSGRAFAFRLLVIFLRHRILICPGGHRRRAEMRRPSLAQQSNKLEQQAVRSFAAPMSLSGSRLAANQIAPCSPGMKSAPCDGRSGLKIWFLRRQMKPPYEFHAAQRGKIPPMIRRNAPQVKTFAPRPCNKIRLPDQCFKPSRPAGRTLRRNLRSLPQCRPGPTIAPEYPAIWPD